MSGDLSGHFSMHAAVVVTPPTTRSIWQSPVRNHSGRPITNHFSPITRELFLTGADAALAVPWGYLMAVAGAGLAAAAVSSAHAILATRHLAITAIRDL